MFKTKKAKLFIIFFLIVLLIATVLITTKIRQNRDNNVAYVSQKTYNYVLSNHIYNNSKFYIAQIYPDSNSGDYGLFCITAYKKMRLLVNLGSTPSIELINDRYYYIDKDENKINSINIYEPFDIEEFPINLTDYHLESIDNHDSDWIYCEVTKWGIVDGDQHRVSAYIAIKLDGSEYKEVLEKDVPK